MEVHHGAGVTSELQTGHLTRDPGVCEDPSGQVSRGVTGAAEDKGSSSSTAGLSTLSSQTSQHDVLTSMDRGESFTNGSASSVSETVQPTSTSTQPSVSVHDSSSSRECSALLVPSDVAEEKKSSTSLSHSKPNTSVSIPAQPIQSASAPVWMKCNSQMAFTRARMQRVQFFQELIV